MKKLWRRIWWYLGARYVLEYSWDSQWVPGWRITSYDKSVMFYATADFVIVGLMRYAGRQSNFSYGIKKLTLEEALAYEAEKSLYIRKADNYVLRGS